MCLASFTQHVSFNHVVSDRYNSRLYFYVDLSFHLLSISFPSNLFSYVSPAQNSFSLASSDLYPSAWGWLCNCLQLSLGASSFSPILWIVSSSHLVIPRFTALSPKLKSSTWLYLGSPSRVLTGKLSPGNNSGQLHTGLTSFASHFSGIAVLACLLFRDLNGISLI